MERIINRWAYLVPNNFIKTGLLMTNNPINNNQLQKKRERISVLVGEGLLTELDLSELLDLPIRTVIKLIDEGQIPGRRIGHNFGRVRTLTSIKDLITYTKNKG